MQLAVGPSAILPQHPVNAMSTLRDFRDGSIPAHGHADPCGGVVSCALNPIPQPLAPEGSRGTLVSSRAVGLVALALAGTFLHAEGVLAKTVVVSKTGVNCMPSVAGPLFTTIQAAVNSLPIAPSATNKVIVCPGTYPEQIKITKNVSITGVLRDGTDPVEIAGNSGEAKIVPPLGGLVADPNFLGNVAAQVSAQNVADLNLTNLRIDGTGIGCPRGADGAPLPTAGIALYNVGVTDSNLRGTVSKTVVHNQIGYCTNAGGALERSYTGEGILVQNSWATIDSNSLSNVDQNPIHQIGGITKINANWLNLGYHGIMLSDVSATVGASLTGSTVSANIVTSFSVGIYLDGSSNVLVKENILTNWNGDAIALTNRASDNQILSNKVVDASHGIFLNFGAARNIVKTNTVVRSVQVGIVDMWSEGGNVITGNTINQSPIGIWTYATLNDVINPNTFFNVDVLNASGPSVP